MCRTVYFKSPSCKHRWIIIGQPCAKDPGFSKCKVFKTKGILPFDAGGPILAAEKTCPVCHLKGKYDRNLTRMVESDVCWFRQPGRKGNKKTVYVDLRCAIL
ncbi:hypothetical protein TESG_02842 [Trichophyton tonsurans CBS 112818]|uniref:Uncharacterized protein n=1 Tax=Trichophyton tonsurans (strain CBS 112818) TaxID=647933 RepID=F2RVK7_TRIT1|nr:hypothetical protein TESG_02842 [Trichophyton tonsurans CBS 112818]